MPSSTTSSRGSTGKKRAAGSNKGGEKGGKKQKKTAATNGKPPKPPKLPTQPQGKKDGSRQEKAEVKKSRPRNFVEEEDVILARAYVNISQDGAIGTNQTIHDFWKRIKEVFDKLVEDDKELEDMPERAPTALQNRFDRHIKPGINRFNSFYKALKESNPSGWNEEKFIDESCSNYLQAEGKPFGFTKCFPILRECPRFDPMICNLVCDPEDEENKVNVVSKIMGEGIERPQGSKAAKAAKKKGKPDAASIASMESSKLATMKHMSASTDRIANSMEFQANTLSLQATISSIMDEARMHKELDNAEAAKACLLEAHKVRKQMQVVYSTEQRKKKSMEKPTARASARASAYSPPPVSTINVEEQEPSNVNEGEEEPSFSENGVEDAIGKEDDTTGPVKFTSVVPDCLDEGDDTSGGSGRGSSCILNNEDQARTAADLARIAKHKEAV